MDDLTISVNLIDVSEDNTSASYHTKSPRLHSHYNAFKKKTNFKSSQEERRQLILVEQKKSRQNLIESKRNLEKQECTQKSTIKHASKRPTSHSNYAEKLMFSEWMEEVPNDLQMNWIMAISPVGKRCLVVASEGNTSVYNKAGKLIAKHFTLLPGGYKGSKTDVTILDCIYCDILRTYFVLDCISWKSHPITDSETEFRFYWLDCKLNEFPEVATRSFENPYVFKNIPRSTDLNQSAIKAQFEKQYEFKIDGVLFFHKETHYTPGFTPLVTWLKPYMLPEVLGIEMPEWVIADAPSDYAGVRKAIDQSIQDEIDRRNRLGLDKSDTNNSSCPMNEDHLPDESKENDIDYDLKLSRSFEQ